MRLSSAALNVARLHVMRATNGGCPPALFLLAHVKSITLGARRPFIEVLARKKSTMTLVDSPSSGSVRPPIDPNVLIGAVTFVVTFAFGFFGFYFAISSDFDSKINKVATMLESKLDGQDRKIDGQDRKVDGIGETVASLPLKFELKKYWSWFGRSTSSVESEDRNMDDVVSKVTKNLDAKVDAIVVEKLDAMLQELKAKAEDHVIDDNSSKKRSSTFKYIFENSHKT